MPFANEAQETSDSLGKEKRKEKIHGAAIKYSDTDGVIALCY